MAETLWNMTTTVQAICKQQQPAVQLTEIPRSHLRLKESFGRGCLGEVCHHRRGIYIDLASNLVCLKFNLELEFPDLVSYGEASLSQKTLKVEFLLHKSQVITRLCYIKGNFTT